jgi:hypothetical protein
MTAAAIVSSSSSQMTSPGINVRRPMPRSTHTTRVIPNKVKKTVVVGRVNRFTVHSCGLNKLALILTTNARQNARADRQQNQCPNNRSGDRHAKRLEQQDNCHHHQQHADNIQKNCDTKIGRSPHKLFSSSRLGVAALHCATRTVVNKSPDPMPVRFGEIAVNTHAIFSKSSLPESAFPAGRS